MIPQEIKDKIHSSYEYAYEGQLRTQSAFYGYSLALPTIEAQAERIKQLEEALERNGNDILISISNTLMRIVNGEGGVTNEVVLKAYKILADDILKFPLPTAALHPSKTK